MRRVEVRINWLKRKLYEWSCHVSVNQAIKDARFQAFQAGSRSVRPVIYGQYCEHCGFRLTEVRRNRYLCPVCEMSSITSGEQGVIISQAGQFSQAFHQAQRAGAGVETGVLAAITKVTQRRLTRRLLPEEGNV